MCTLFCFACNRSQLKKCMFLMICGFGKQAKRYDKMAKEEHNDKFIWTVWVPFCSWPRNKCRTRSRNWRNLWSNWLSKCLAKPSTPSESAPGWVRLKTLWVLTPRTSGPTRETLRATLKAFHQTRETFWTRWTPDLTRWKMQWESTLGWFLPTPETCSPLKETYRIYKNLQTPTKLLEHC